MTSSGTGSASSASFAVACSSQITRGGELLKTHHARHNPGKAKSAFATPG